MEDDIVGFVGIQGDVTIGMQGIGMRTPCAAAVAAATRGFVIVTHNPKGMMLTMGTKSLIVAKGKPEPITGDFGMTTKADGAIPKEHLRQAPETTTGM